MHYGYIELIILIFIFFGLQLWWILLIIKKNKEINKSNINLNQKINLLEKIYKK